MAQSQTLNTPPHHPRWVGGPEQSYSSIHTWYIYPIYGFKSSCTHVHVHVLYVLQDQISKEWWLLVAWLRRRCPTCCPVLFNIAIDHSLTQRPPARTRPKSHQRAVCEPHTRSQPTLVLVASRVPPNHIVTGPAQFCPVLSFPILAASRPHLHPSLPRPPTRRSSLFQGLQFSLGRRNNERRRLCIDSSAR